MELDRLKDLYNNYHSDENVAKRKYYEDNPHMILFEDHILSAAIDAARKGEDKGHVRPGHVIIAELLKDFDLYQSECRKRGLKLEKQFIGNKCTSMYVSGWV